MKKQINKSGIKELNAKIESNYEIINYFSKKDKIEIVDNEFVLRNGTVEFFTHNDIPIPTLKTIMKSEKKMLKKVIVDMGAIRFVTSGADIMRPGIVTYEADIEKRNFVVIVDEKHGKALAIGEMLFSATELNSKDGGRVIKNLHYVGDKIWKEY